MSADSTARNRWADLSSLARAVVPQVVPKARGTNCPKHLSPTCWTTWEEHGQAVLDRVIAEAPTAYVKVIAGVVPRELNVKGEGLFAIMSDEDLDKAIAALIEATKLQAPAAH